MVMIKPGDTILFRKFSDDRGRRDEVSPNREAEQSQ